MKRILMIMCLLMTVCLFGCNKEETEPKDDTGDVTDVTDGIDYAALASSMTFFLDPLKPAFGDMEKADELAIDTGSPDYDVKAGMSAFYNAGKKRFYVNYDTMDIDKFYYIIEIEKLDDGDTFLRLQQHQFMGDHNDVTDKAFLFKPDGTVKFGHRFESTQGSDPSIDALTWSYSPKLPVEIRKSVFIDIIKTMRDSKYGQILEQLICTDILINDIRMLEGDMAIDESKVPADSENIPMPSEGSAVVADPYQYFELENSTNLDHQKGTQIYMQAGKTCRDGAIVNFTGKPLGYVQVKKDKVIRIRKTYGTDADVLGHIYDYAVMPYYETKDSGGYRWYRIGTDMWIADDGTWLTVIN